jgi:hypothetical protein
LQRLGWPEGAPEDRPRWTRHGRRVALAQARRGAPWTDLGPSLAQLVRLALPPTVLAPAALGAALLHRPPTSSGQNNLKNIPIKLIELMKIAHRVYF